MPKGWANKRLRVIERDNGMCYLCGLPGANSVDHVIPHAKGGTDAMTNLRAAHMTCNTAKRAKVGSANPRESRFG
jgi:5-methylcytosine-specific restriction endonuclease McrA